MKANVLYTVAVIGMIVVSVMAGNKKAESKSESNAQAVTTEQKAYCATKATCPPKDSAAVKACCPPKDSAAVKACCPTKADCGTKDSAKTGAQSECKKGSDSTKSCSK